MDVARTASYCCNCLKLPRQSRSADTYAQLWLLPIDLACMTGRIASGLQLALASLVLLLLHLIHASTLLLSLFLHLAASLQSGSQRLDSSSLQQDRLRWRKKRPKHLAIVFVPAARGRFDWRQLRYVPWPAKVVVKGMLRDLRELVRWSHSLAIESLQLYDEHGKSFTASRLFNAEAPL